MAKVDEQEVYRQVTHLGCLSCNTATPVTDIGFEILSDDDVYDAYDEVACCDEPALVALIITQEPLFSEEINEDSWSERDERYEYTVNDDLFATLNKNEASSP